MACLCHRDAPLKTHTVTAKQLYLFYVSRTLSFCDTLDISAVALLWITKSLWRLTGICQKRKKPSSLAHWLLIAREFRSTAATSSVTTESSSCCKVVVKVRVPFFCMSQCFKKTLTHAEEAKLLHWHQSRLQDCNIDFQTLPLRGWLVTEFYPYVEGKLQDGVMKGEENEELKRDGDGNRYSLLKRRYWSCYWVMHNVFCDISYWQRAGTATASIVIVPICI